MDPCKLKVNLFDVVHIKMGITAGPDKITRIEVALLGHHMGKQGIAAMLKGNPRNVSHDRWYN